MSRRTSLLAALGLAATLGTAAAQTPQAPPPAMPLTPATFPPFQEAVLPNGLRLIVVANRRLPIVSMSLSFNAGRVADPVGKEGLASMVAGLLTKGAGTRTGNQVAEAIEQVGGSIGAGSGSDFLTGYAGSLSKDVGLAFDLLGDAVIRPRFDSTEVELLRTQMLSGLDLQRSQPDAIASRQLDQLLYGDHPYARNPTAASVRGITRADLLRFQRARLRPAGALLVIAGDITLADARRHAARAFRGWTGAPTPLPAAKAPPARRPTEIVLVHRPGSVQSNIVVGSLTYRPGEPRHYAAMVANRVLGDGADSRLFSILREQKSWTYGAYSGLERRRGLGTFQATTEVRTEVTDSALAEVLKQLTRIGAEPVPATELEQAKSAIVGSYPLSVQTAEQVAGAVSDLRRYGLAPDFLTSYRLRIGAVTAAEVQAAAAAFMRADSAVVVVVGDGAKLAERLRTIGPVRMVDVDGKALTDQDLRPAAVRLPIDLAKLVPSRDSFAVVIQGNALGYSVTSIEDAAGGKRLTEKSNIGGIVEQTTTIEIGADGSMLRVRQNGKVQGQPTTISLDYAATSVKGTANTVSPEGPKTVAIDTAIAAGTIDDNAIQGILPGLPWALGASWSFSVFAGGQNESRVTTLKVVGTETVTTPAGPVEAFKTEWSGGWQPATFWVTTAAPHRLLKIGIANTPVEMIRVK